MNSGDFHSNQEKLNNNHEQARGQYQSFFADNIAMITWIELRNPVSIKQPIEDQVDEIFKEAYVKDISQAAEIFGFNKREDILGKPITDLWPEGSYDRGALNHNKYVDVIKGGYKAEQKIIESITIKGEVKSLLSNVK